MSKRFWIVGLPVSLVWSLILWALVFWVVSAFASTYYVSNSGSDSNAGTSTSTPWRTIAKVNAGAFQPGDSILFHRGGTWREQLTVPSSGASGNPITFGAYGSGVLPTINGSNIISSGGWVSAWPANLSISKILSSGPLTGDWGLRYTISANTFSTNANTITLTFASSTSASTTISGVYIGQKASSGDAWAMQPGTVSQFKFSGNTSVTVPASGSVTTDKLSYPFNCATTYIISVGYSSASVMYTGGADYGETYGRSGDDANGGMLDPASYSDLGYNWHGLQMVTLVGAGVGSQTDTWAAPMTNNVYGMWFDGTPGTLRFSLAGCNAERDFYYSGGYVFVYTTNPSGPGSAYSMIEATQHDYGVTASSKNYIAVENLHLTKTGARGVDAEGNYWTVTDDTIDNLGSSRSGYGQGVLLAGNDSSVSDCAISNINEFGVAVTGNDDVVGPHNTMSGCWDGLTYAQSGAGAGVRVLGSSNRVTSNFIYDSYHCVDDVGGSLDALVDHNLCVTWGTNGIDHENGTFGHPMKIYNNTVIHEDGSGWGSGHGIVCQTSGDYADIENNIVVVNGIQPNTNYEAIAIGADSEAGLTLDYNLYYLVAGTTGTIGELGTTQYSTLPAWQAAVSGLFTGKDVHSLSSDPLFLNSSGSYSFPTDFKLQPNSPAIDGGTNVGLTKDFAGKTVPGPKGVSVGAYEWYPIGPNEPLWFDPYHIGHRRY